MSPMPIGPIIGFVALCVVGVVGSLAACIAAALLLPWYGALPIILTNVGLAVWATRRFVFGIK